MPQRECKLDNRATGCRADEDSGRQDRRRASKSGRATLLRSAMRWLASSMSFQPRPSKVHHRMPLNTPLSTDENNPPKFYDECCSRGIVTDSSRPGIEDRRARPGIMETLAAFMSCQRGPPIFSPRDPPDYLYCVVRGAAREYALTTDGRRQILAFRARSWAKASAGCRHEGRTIGVA